MRMFGMRPGNRQAGSGKQPASKEDAVRVFGVSGQAHQVPRDCAGYEHGLSPITKPQNSEPVSARYVGRH